MLRVKRAVEFIMGMQNRPILGHFVEPSFRVQILEGSDLASPPISAEACITYTDMVCLPIVMVSLRAIKKSVQIRQNMYSGYLAVGRWLLDNLSKPTPIKLGIACFLSTAEVS